MKICDEAALWVLLGMAWIAGLQIIIILIRKWLNI